ncbi:restriction endonuclease [Paraclostridium sordellii]|uniref:restriction endonuclease n=1 Tax=Paraclostridium sordellii TaxID=1505 RepID=UPI0005E99F14|nr:restriction endonuclease [Paeniclostridium sordellii]CEQ16693.1 restriction endonuclease [[Clostridium] sordellii] [Paeniclostridium sordellii]CEQ26345.1 restriction endonuclease [[Clostridium] sordellii] [Paeniclostridium sordellii]
MARKKGISTFVNQVSKELIKEQRIKDKEVEQLKKRYQKELEKQQKEDYINSRYKEVSKLNLSINNEIYELKNLILNGINEYKPIPIDTFIKKDIQEFIIPKELNIKYEKPNKPIIRKANIFEILFKSYRLKYHSYVDELERKYDKEYKLYKKNEVNRKNEIKNLKKSYELKLSEIIAIKKDLYINGDVGMITSYKKELLNNSKYPFEFKKNINIGYCKYTKNLLIDYLLPKKDIVQSINKYKYMPKLDEIREVQRKNKDINSIYNEVIYSIVLRSMDEVFKSDIYGNIKSIVFNGYIEDIDLSTGQDIKPYIISSMIEKQDFRKIDLKRIDKLTCLKDAMQSRISLNSNLEFKSIVPIYNYDYVNNSIISSENINLLEINPYELERLVTILFRNMGYNVEETKKSHDGGIDCFLNYNDPIIGGKVIGQVKRYKNNIDIPKLREFESVLRNSDAMKGLFISTSNFSPQCEKFALENNITLINGCTLLKYFNEYGINSYIQDKF